MFPRCCGCSLPQPSFTDGYVAKTLSAAPNNANGNRCPKPALFINTPHASEATHRPLHRGLRVSGVGDVKLLQPHPIPISIR